ncbi:gamma-glutamyltranspeptidase [Vairimorpha necatrix]|uniref:Glutathione hydrolase n=1 Tax=Vairimorpha necatrix TaxID=6039 RepID=A0AAX4JG03_9MICR
MNAEIKCKPNSLDLKEKMILYKNNIINIVLNCFKKKFHIRKFEIKIIDMLTFCILFLLQIEHSYAHNNGIYQSYAVSSELPIASEIGVKIMERGGNAVDAAIGICIAIGIENAFSSGIGGGGFALVKKRGESEPAYMLDFREKSGENFVLSDYIKNPEKTSVGGAAVAIPSEVRGLKHLHDKMGKLPWSKLFTECIELCKNFRVSKEIKKRIERHKEFILKDRGLSEIYSRNGVLLSEGDYIERKNYMKTLEIISKDPESFYVGDLSKHMIKSINSNGGNVTERDFENVQPVERKVITEKYKDYNVYTTSLPSSGALVIKALKLLERYDLVEIYKTSKKNNKARHIHLLVEILKFVMSQRGIMGDPKYLPAFNTVTEDLFGKTNLDIIFKKLNTEKTLKFEEYNVNEFNVVDHGTTHINVVDKDGLAVALTSTINLEWGAKFMDPITGIIFNNQIDDFYFPKSFDENSRVANIAGPNKIPLSSIAPVILENKEEMILLGAAGGIRIPTSIIEVLFWLSLDFDLKQAIDKPRLHHQLDPNVLYVEWSEDAKVQEYLRSLGHKVETSNTNSIFTSVQGIKIDYKNNKKRIHAVSDKRKGGMTAGK